MARDETAVDKGAHPELERGYGYFVAANASVAKSINCEGLPTSCEDTIDCAGTANTITHADNSAKNNVDAIWTPPTSMSRHTITFVATVVEKNGADGSVWYGNVTSNSLDLNF